MAETSKGTPARAPREPRHKAREAAVQMLYQWEVGRQPMPEVIRSFWTHAPAASASYPEALQAFASTLAAGTVERVAELDRHLSEAAKNWRVERNPVRPNRAEHVEFQSVVERLGLVRHTGGHVQHLPLADDDVVAAHPEPDRALQDVGHLLAVVGVHRHQGAPLQVDLRQGLAFPGHDLPGEHLGDLLEGNFVPAVQAGGGGHTVSDRV